MTKLSRRRMLKTAGIGAAATAIAAPAVAQSMPEIKWRLTTSFPKSLDTLHGGAAVFGCRRGAERHGRAVLHRVVLLYRQGHDVRVAVLVAVRAQYPHAERL